MVLWSFAYSKQSFESSTGNRVHNGTMGYLWSASQSFELWEPHRWDKKSLYMNHYRKWTPIGNFYSEKWLPIGSIIHIGGQSIGIMDPYYRNDPYLGLPIGDYEITWVCKWQFVQGSAINTECHVDSTIYSPSLTFKQAIIIIFIRGYQACRGACGAWHFCIPAKWHGIIKIYCIIINS